MIFDNITSTYYLQDACACSVICYFAPTSGKPNLPTYIAVKWGQTDGPTDGPTYLIIDASMHASKNLKI